jgi:hypothetical protein
MRTADYIERHHRRAAARAVSGQRITAQIEAVAAQLDQAAELVALTAGDISRRTGPGWAHFDGTLADALAAMTLDTAQRTAEALRKEWLPVVREAVDKWPVDTGRSLEGLTLSFDASTGALRSRLSSAARYTYLIRYPGGQRLANGANRMVWEESVKKPTRLVARRIIDRLAGRRS